MSKYTPQNFQRQPYVSTGRGELDRSKLDGQLNLIGQSNPYKVERWKMQHGRNLSGLGGTPGAAYRTTVSHQDSHFRNPEVQNLEQQDDVKGSGIFDGQDFSGTVHPELGIFADHPNIPGYIAREVQFAENREVPNVASGAALVVVPGGGMSYLERNGKRAPYLNFDAIDINIQNGKKKKRPGPSGTVSGNNLMTMVPTGVTVSPVDGQGTSTAAMIMAPVTAFTQIPVVGPPPIDLSTATPVASSGFGRLPRMGGAIQRSAHRWPRAPGFGDLPATPPATPLGLGTYLFAGVLVGIAAAMVVGTTKMKGSR